MITNVDFAPHFMDSCRKKRVILHKYNTTLNIMLCINDRIYTPLHRILRVAFNNKVLKGEKYFLWSIVEQIVEVSVITSFKRF